MEQLRFEERALSRRSRLGEGERLAAGMEEQTFTGIRERRLELGEAKVHGG